MIQSIKRFVDVVTAEVRVAVGRFHFDDAFADLEDRDIERTAAEVEYRDGLVFFLVQTVGQSCRRRLVDDTQDFESRDLTGVFRRLTLSVVKVSRNGDNGLIDLRTEIILGRLLQFLQHHRRDLRRAVLLCPRASIRTSPFEAFHFIRHLLDLFLNLVIATSHEPLDRIKRVFGVGDGLAFGDLADQAVAVLGKRDDRRRRAPAFGICDDDRLAAFHHGNDRIGRSQVDTYNFAHIFLISNKLQLNARQYKT